MIENKRVLVKLKLSQSMKIYNIFDLNLFCKTSIDLLINQVNEPPSPFIVNNKKEWEVENILDAKSH